jgi:excisionase family DNA binding protein
MMQHHELTAEIMPAIVADTRLAKPLALYLALADIFGCAHAPIRVDALGMLCSVKPETIDSLMRFAEKGKAELARWSLTSQDVAGQLSVSPRTVERLAQSGALEGIRAGRLGWRFCQDGLDRFVARHTYVNDERLPFEPEPDRVDITQLEDARQALGAGAWGTSDLAGALGISRDAAYILVLGWHSAGFVNHCSQRGRYVWAQA